MRRCAYCGGAVQPYFRFCCRLCAVFGTKRFNDYDAKAPCKLDTPEAERTFREKFIVNRRGPWSYSRRAAVRLSWRNYSTGVSQEIDTVPEAQAMGFLTECVNELQRLRKIRKLKVAA
jgi:hypothetical protein